MKKLSFLVFVALFAYSCAYDGIEYDGGTKKVFEGQLTNQAGNPLSGIKVSAYISNGSDADIVSYDYTDSNGYYKMVFPDVEKFDGENAYVALLVNQERYTEVSNSMYSSYTIHNIRLNEMQHHKINFGPSALFSPQNSTTLSINFVPSSGATQRPAINLKGMVDRNFADYSLPLNDVFNYYLNQVNFTVAKNQTIVLLYQPVNPDGSLGDIEEVEISIGNDPVVYTLTY